MPTTTGRATDYITFTRTSNATVTDSNGFIEWAGHNLLTNSESFDASAWSRQGLSGVTANAIAAPNGTTTADKLLENNLNDFHYVTQLNVIDNSAPVSTLSVFAKAAERQYLNLALAWGANFVAATFDLTGGTVTSNRSGGTGASQSSSITPVGGGWYLCTLRGTIGTGGSDAAIIAISDSATPTGAYPQYTGTTGNGFHIWGAHLYRSDLGGMVLNPARGDAYYPTTPRNLLGFTEDFNSWTKNAATVTTNSAIAPNGLQTADLIVNTTDTSAHGVYQSISFSTACTMSVYAKAGASNFVGLTNTSSTTPAAYSGAVFNLASGTVTLSNNCTATITAVGDGWYRCAITALTVAGSFFIVYVGQNGTSAPWTSYTGSGQSIYLWGAQLSDSASLDAYSPVYGAAVTSAAYYAPRLDYDPVTLAPLGLLVEELRANLLTYSNELNNAAWAPTSATVTANALVSPDGTSSAETVAGTASTTSYLASPTATVATSTTYNISIYVKYQSSLLSRIRVYDSGLGTELAGVVFAWSAGVPSTNTTSGTWVTAPTYTSVGNGWYRLSGAFSSGAFTGLKVLFYPDQSALGTSTAVWGAQLELGSFATSYIPTGASTATRFADLASVSTQAFPYSASASTLVVSVRTTSGGTAANMTNATDATGVVERCQVRTNGTEFQLLSGTGGAGPFGAGGVYISGGTFSGGEYKAAFAIQTNDAVFVVNGSTIGSDTTSVSVPNINLLRLGYIGSSDNGNYLNGHIRQITYLPRRITNSELQARTV